MKRPRDNLVEKTLNSDEYIDEVFLQLKNNTISIDNYILSAYKINLCEHSSLDSINGTLKKHNLKCDVSVMEKDNQIPYKECNLNICKYESNFNTIGCVIIPNY